MGSDPNAVDSVGGKEDFGVSADPQDRAEQEIVSREIKSQDPGGGTVRSSANVGDRTSGVGGNASGPGSSSGGDLDPSIVGVGTHGAGVSQSGPDDRLDTADVSTDPVSEFNAGADAKKRPGSRSRR